MTTKTAGLKQLSQQYAYFSLQLHETIARKAGFSGTDHKYLGFFLTRGKLTAGELATLTGLTTGAVTGLIDRFEKKGLVQRQFDPSDRRKVWLQPDSEKISALIQPYYVDFQEKLEEIIAAYSTEDKNTIASFFEQSIYLLQTTNNQFK